MQCTKRIDVILKYGLKKYTGDAVSAVVQARFPQNEEIWSDFYIFYWLYYTILYFLRMLLKAPLCFRVDHMYWGGTKCQQTVQLSGIACSVNWG